MTITVVSAVKNEVNKCKYEKAKDFCNICYLENLVSTNWKKHLNCEFDKQYFEKLKTFLHGKKIYPSIENIFSFTNYFNLEDTKVVILGQDPYHNPNQATGLAFSVPTNIKIPPSLKNIYKELANDISGFKIPNHGNLENWAKQGVLLLNDVLTVEHNQPASHSKIGWKDFTLAILNKINKNCINVVFILWGNYAKSKSKHLDSKNHLILTAAHPSPFSATKFYGCQHFSKANDYLKKCGKSPIDWHIL